MHIARMVCCAMVAASMAQAQAAMGDSPSRDSLQHLLRDRVDAGRTTGIIVGVLRPDGSAYYAAAGNARVGRALDDSTVFEIGSITKAFTGILLADMVARGEVRLDQPVAELLPAGVKVPERNGRRITLGDLSMQISGLPRLPSNMQPADSTNPYADYTPRQLYDFLAVHELRRDPGAQYEYSNLGVGLLGHALALRSGISYETLLRARVLEPLDMDDTGITLTPAVQSRMSEGHDGAGRVVPLWDIPTLAGAGALRSSLRDMLKLAAAMAAPPPTPVGRAIAQSLVPRHRVNQALTMGLGWHRVVLGGDTVAFHNGGTAGFRTYIGVNLRTRSGVVLLSNSSQDNEEIARHVLVPSLPVAKVVRRNEITLSAAVLAQYAGTYRLSPQFALTIAVVDGALTARGTGQPSFPLFAEARDRFFLKAVDAQIEFTRDATGAVTGLVLLQNGGRVTGAKETP